MYNKQIDATVFQKKIEQYIAAQGKFNVKWEVFADCVLPTNLIPSEIQCVDGKPVLKYGAPEN
ncbi:hypothetical protein D3C80_2168990 [compost metagenome]